MCSPSPPPATDYAAAATAQGAANTEAARATAKLSNPNINSPLGSQRVTYGTPQFDQAGYDKAVQAFKGGQPTTSFDQSGYDAALSQYNASKGSNVPQYTQRTVPGQEEWGTTENVLNPAYVAPGNAPDRNAFTKSTPFSGTEPSRDQFTTYGGDLDVPTVTQTYSPEQQALYDQQTGISKRLGELSTSGLDWLSNTVKTPLDTSGATAFNSGPDPAAYSMARQLNDPGGIQSSFDRNAITNSVDYSSAPALQSSYDFSKLSEMPGADEATRKAVADAIMARQKPTMDANRDQLNTQLITRGFRPGTEAYAREMQRLGAQENDMLLAADVAGGQEMERLFGMGMQTRQQGANEAMAQGNFGNQSRAQQIAEILSQAQFGNQAQAQDFDQRANQAQFANAAQQQKFGQNLSAANFQNAATEAEYRQALSGAQFGNQTRAQQIQEALMMRQLPLSELNSLRTGAQPTIPQFQNYSGAQVAPAPVFGAAQQAGDYSTDIYNAQAASADNTQSGLFKLGAAAMMFSDRRLKSNIERIGTHPLGIGIYEYDIFGRRDRGVMADEVAEVMPGAVLRHASGYLMVDYAQLGAV